MKSEPWSCQKKGGDLDVERIKVADDANLLEARLGGQHALVRANGLGRQIALHLLFGRQHKAVLQQPPAALCKKAQLSNRQNNNSKTDHVTAANKAPDALQLLANGRLGHRGEGAPHVLDLQHAPMNRIPKPPIDKGCERTTV